MRTDTALMHSSNELSIYGDKLTTKGVISNVAKIKKAFPSLPMGFYEIFDERLKANGFTDERLADAVNHVIDTCIYPTPTIANFIGYDKRIKLYTHNEIIRKMESDGNNVWEKYKPVKFTDQEKLIWVSIDDIKKYNLKTE